MELSSKQRAFLKKMAHEIDPVVRIESIANAVKKRELIKVKILQNSEVEVARELGNELASKTKSVFVDSIGRILIFFKANNKDGKITKEFNEFKKKGKK